MGATTGRVIASITVPLDGYVTGPDDGVGEVRRPALNGPGVGSRP